MSFWNRFFRTKASVGQTALLMNQVGKAQSTPRNYESFSKEGYQANVIAYKCVSIISKSAAAVDWNLYQKRRGASDDMEIKEHEILNLLNRPNPLQGRSSFFENLVAYYMLSGNSYLEASGESYSSPALELWCLRPDYMKVVAGESGIPDSYIYGSQNIVKFPVDSVNGRSQILHLKTFHPTNNYYGLSPIEAAMYSVDQHNESSKWNLAMLSNMGTPSGAFVVKQDDINPSGILPAPQYNNLKNQIRNQIQGSQNAGRVILLEGGIDWKQMGLSQKDMDWVEGRKMSARDISLAFGVPPIILNIPGDSTFNNYKEARLALYEDTIIPILELIRTEFNRWLVPRWGTDLYLDFDIDSIQAISEKRSEKYSSLNQIQFLTINEKRESVGYGPIDGGDELLVPSGQIPISDALLSDQLTTVPDVVTSPNPTPEPDPTPAQDNLNDSGSMGADTKIELKQVNVLTPRGKRRAWNDVNKVRNDLAKAMRMDLTEFFDNQSSKLANSLRGIDMKLWEFAIINEVDKQSDELKRLIEKHQRRAIKTFSMPILEAGKACDLPDFETKTLLRFNQFVDSFIDRETAKQITQIDGTTKKKARKIIQDVIREAVTGDEQQSELQVVQNIKTELDSLTDGRARTIARTEIGLASTNGALEAAKALDIPDLQKEWVSDQRPFADLRDGEGGTPDHQAMNGVKVPITEKFTVPPDADMDGPHDASASADQIINCQCILIFSRAGKLYFPTVEVS